MKFLSLIEFFRNLVKSRYYKRRLVQSIIFVLIFFIFCAGLFWFEYTGKDAALVDKYPALRVVKYLPKILNVYYLPLIFGHSDLPSYELIIDKNYLADLDKIVPKNVCCNCLPAEASKYEKAKFIFTGKEYQVKIKVRGDCSNHWSDAKKSWRLKFADDDLFFGLNQFDLIIPDDREFVGELLNNYRAKKFGLTVPEMNFVTLKINGRYFGPYLFQEAIGSNLFKNEINGSSFEIFGEKLIADDLFLDVKAWQRYDDNQTDNQVGDFAKLDQLLKLINNASDEEFYQKIVKIVDLENFYEWNILSLLAGSYHQDFAHNMRIYFDTNIGKFKFIPADVGLSSFSPVDVIYNPLVTRIIKNPEFLQERNKVLWDYIKEENNLDDDLKFFDQAYNQLRWPLYRDLKSTYSNFYFDKKISLRRQRFIDLFQEAKNNLNSGEVKIKISSTFVSKMNFLSPVSLIEFIVDNFSGIKWNYLQFSLPADGLGADFFLYFDANRNGLLDGKDEKIGNLKAEGNKLIMENINQQLLAKRLFPDKIVYRSQDREKSDTYLLKPLKIESTKYDYFIGASAGPVNLPENELKECQFTIANAITGRVINYEIN